MLEVGYWNIQSPISNFQYPEEGETMTEEIVFKTEADMPPLPMTLGTTLVNKTGNWRYIRPLYMDKTPPCNHNCPAGEDIVGYLALIKEGKYKEGWELIRQENPFPGVCGRVCPHPCESECNREELGGAIAIHTLEQFLADRAARNEKQGMSNELLITHPSSPVAVIGSGPAGLSCAYHLARRGYPVTVFEALPVAGGMMRVGIPGYRLPREVLDREIADIEALGVEIKTGMRLGDNLRMSDLDDYDAVFIAVGLQESHKLNIPGEDAEGVIPGLEFLQIVNLGEKVQVGPRVAVIGGGNTAIDAARTALRLGSEVTILYRRTRAEMPAIAEEIEEALAEGVEIRYLTAPVELLTENSRVKSMRCVKMELGAPDDSGRRRPVPIAGSEYNIEVDTVIPALGQEADFSFLEAGGRRLEVGGWKLEVERERIVTDEAGLTTREGVFAGGDVATPFGTVTHAVGSGKRAALAIDKYLRGEELSDFPPIAEAVHAVPKDIDPAVVRFEDLNLAYFEELERTGQLQKPIEERLSGFEEVNLGFSEEEAQAEAERCFSCGTCNLCDTCFIFCPDVAITRLVAPPPLSPPHLGGMKGGWPLARLNGAGYEVNYDYCKGCGVCAEECPRCAISIEEEIKWKK
jgi:NADPH-dependent glutamate synthase beta subunit-like oxidoreductase